MVADDDGWLVEVFLMGVADREFDARNPMPQGDESGEEAKYLMQLPTSHLLVFNEQGIEHRNGIGDDDGNEEEQQGVDGPQYRRESPPDGKWQTIYDSQQAEHGIEHEDAREVCDWVLPAEDSKR